MDHEITDYIDINEAAEPETAYQINNQLNLARRIVEETGENLFLTGKAGTGKTTFLRRLRRKSVKRMVVLAPTGVAAINAEGSTIHSFFQFNFSPYIPGKGFLEQDRKFIRFSKEKRRIIASLDLLVIDEISMVRPDTIDAIDAALRRYRNPEAPFGGAQLLLIGDLRQLSPVVKEDEWNILRQHYSSPYFFESHALRRSGFTTIELTAVFRQSDRDFISLLNAVRDGAVTPEIMARLNERYKPTFNPDDSENYIRLTTHNYMANAVNARHLEMLKTTSAHYKAIVSGNFPEYSYPTDFDLHLKIGAQVMFVKNDSGEDRRFYNGMIGVVTGMEEDTIAVRPADGSPVIKAERMEWENTKYVINEETKEIEQSAEGTFRQFPLRLAWAITIHKSQGMTFERAIIDSAEAFAPGQTYVALSRCRSLEGLVLGQFISPSAVIIDSTVNSFVDYCSANRVDDSGIDSMRARYTCNLLAELFDFRNLRLAFDEFNRYMQEYAIPLYPEYYHPYRNMATDIAQRMEGIGLKFARLYASCPIDPAQLQADRNLLERIKGGCLYFLDELKTLRNLLNDTHINLQNKEYVERLTNANDNLEYQIKIKDSLLRKFATADFNTADYLHTKAEAVIEGSAPKAKKAMSYGSKSKNTKLAKEKTTPKSTMEPERQKPVAVKEKTPRKPKKEKASKKPVGYSKQESLNMFLVGKDIPAIAKERGLAISTISSHLGECVAEKRLDIKKVLNEGVLSDMEKTFEGNIYPKDARERDNRRYPEHYYTFYYNAVIRPVKTGPDSV